VADKVCMTCQEGIFWRTVSLLLTVQKEICKPRSSCFARKYCGGP